MFKVEISAIVKRDGVWDTSCARINVKDDETEIRLPMSILGPYDDIDLDTVQARPV